MSVFNADDQDADNPLETLVGEGKKYKTPEDLAKAYLHADQTISQRNQELSDLRTDLNSRLTAEQLLDKIAQRNAPPVSDPKPEAHQPAKPAVTADELAALVQEEIVKSRKQEQVQSNVETVSTKLVELYGDTDKANQVVRTKAAELGVSVEFLQDVAAKSPKAFFVTIGVDDQKPAGPRPTQSDVNPSAFSKNSPQVKAGTYSWYQQLRKDNPKAYWDPKMQNQMHKDAAANPEGFFTQ